MRALDVFRDIEQIRSQKLPVVGLGVFDGLHRGHVKVVEKVKKEAKKKNALAGIVTFWPHPARVLRSTSASLVLMTLEQKTKLLEKMGIDVILVLEFTRKLAETDPEMFLERTLKEALGVQCVVVGENYIFGRNGRGNVDLLQKLGPLMEIDIVPVSEEKLHGERISSSLIRALIARGEWARAEHLLGRPYIVWGEVIRGKGRGRELGFPTVNLRCEQEVFPSDGVYLGEGLVEDGVDLALINLGCSPTFHDVRERRLEVHLLSMNLDLYGKVCGVRFLKRIRDEKGFSDREDLIQRMERDRMDAVEWASERRRDYPNRELYLFPE